MFKKMDKEVATNIRFILNRELPLILAKHGLKLDLGNGSFDDDSVKFAFKIKLENAKRDIEKALASDIKFRKDYEQIELDITKIHQARNGKKYSLVGYKSKSRKLPYVVLNLTDGKEYLISTDEVERHFGIHKAQCMNDKEKQLLKGV